MKSLLLLLIILMPVATKAQVWYIGAKAGTTFSNYKAKTPWKEVSNMGFTFGATAYKQTKKNWGFSFEVQYIQKGYYHKICNDIYDQLEANYLEVPIMIDYGFLVPGISNLKTHLNLGIYGAYWLSGKYKMEGFEESSEDFDFEKSKASRFDLGPNLGGRFEYLLKNGSLNLDFRYELGVLDLQKQVNDNTSNTNRALVIGLSYMKIIN
jgi:hypothetical protein